MPSYDYRCKSCDEVFTFEKSMTDDTVPNCPKCKSTDVAKVWGNIQFKGCSSSSACSSDCGSCSSGSCCGH